MSSVEKNSATVVDGKKLHIYDRDIFRRDFSLGAVKQCWVVLY